VLSDSGGFQVFSLIRQNPNAGTIRQNEVIFREPATGEKIVLTPEKVIQLQLQLDSDIVVCLDDCTSADESEAEQARAVERTVRWAGRCRAEFDRLLDAAPRRIRRRGTREDEDGRRDGEARPLLFAVVQGGASETLRRQCATDLASIGFDGFGYGGWPIAPDGSLLTNLLRHVAEGVPRGAPLHALGVGRPDHVVRAAALGYTMFDCTLPTRDARHHRLLNFLPGHDRGRFDADTPFFEYVYILDQRHANDFGPVDPTCDAPCCTLYSRAYLRHLFKIEDATAERLASIHNLRFYTRLIDGLRRQRVRQPQGEGAAQEMATSSGSP
jgi:queuine tRNA-ribosyltransferase